MMRKMVGADKVLDSKSTVDLERLPPPKVCLIPHVQRANYRVAFYKRADEAIIESPKAHDPGMGREETGDEEVVDPSSLLLLLRYWLREQSPKSTQLLTR
ncbi:hypothetical protein CgunFtcFv8_004885 [Champsocephalus gunnari]|uniref:Uncharacterized protein n=1 Tax=Champsocephalus gunnari TaxID=52237 RepID=A0AAN8E528_CHAGU|nr:hypothetical protein CgunFtcFv8_004885 [Champsocephalus gunnari]